MYQNVQYTMYQNLYHVLHIYQKRQSDIYENLFSLYHKECRCTNGKVQIATKGSFSQIAKNKVLFSKGVQIAQKRVLDQQKDI